MGMSTGGGGSRVPLSEINVTPLVDVMLVLLIIFMVAAPMLQKGIEVNLPVARRADKMPEERMYITVPLSYRTSGKVFMDKEEVPKAVLPERMRQVMSTKDQKEVYLRGDGGVERVGIVALPAPPRGRR